MCMFIYHLFLVEAVRKQSQLTPTYVLFMDLEKEVSSSHRRKKALQEGKITFDPIEKSKIVFPDYSIRISILSTYNS